MRYLILKEMLLQKWMFLYVFLYTIAIGVLGRPDGAHQVGTLLGLILILRVSSLDGRRSHILLNSLPVPKWKIIGAKYVFVLCYAVGAMLGAFLVGYVLDSATVSLAEPILGVTAVAAVSSLYWPVHYRFEYAFVWLFIVFFAVSGTFPFVESVVARLLSGTSGGDLPKALAMAGIGAFMTALSMWLSVRFYRQKEF